MSHFTTSWGMETCHRAFNTQQLRNSDKVQDGDRCFSPGVSPRGDWMFSVDLQDAYFQVPVHQESHLYLRFCVERCVYQFKALCFGLSTAPQVFTRVFVLVSEWAPSPLSGRLAGGCRIEGPASSPSGPSSPVVRRSRDFGQLEEVGPCTFDLSSVPRHGDRHVSRASVSISGSSDMLQGGSHIFSPPSFSTSTHVAAATWPYDVSGAFSSWGTHLHSASPVAVEGQLVASGWRPSQPDPLVSGLCGGS